MWVSRVAFPAFVLVGVGCQVIGGLGELELGSGGAGGAGGMPATNQASASSSSSSSSTSSSTAGTGAGGGGGVDVTAIWSERFGDATTQLVTDVAIDGNGDIVIAGSFLGTLDFGSGIQPLVTAGDHDAFVAKLDQDGHPLWAVRLGGQGTDKALGIATTQSNHVVVAGEFVGPVSYNGQTLGSPLGATDAFALKLDGATGNPIWVHDYIGSGTQRGTAIASIPGANTIFALGTFESQINFGGQSATSKGAEDLFLAELASTNGAYGGSTLGGGSGGQIGNAIALTADSSILVAGQFETTLDWSANVQSAGGFDGFVTKLSPTRQVQWTQRFGDGGEQRALGVAANGGGAVVVGAFEGSFDVGGKVVLGKGGRDALVLALGADGSATWVRGIGDGDSMAAVDDQEATDVAVAGDGSIYVTGWAAGAVDFGGGAQTGVGDADLFILKLDANGQTVWAKRAGGDNPQYGRAIAVAPGGDVVVAGDFRGTLDLGNGALTSAGSNDIFVAKLPASP